MSVEILLMVNLVAITLLAYMVAINAHGPTRLGISYLLATLLLAGTVWIVVQQVNSGHDRQKVEELRLLDMQKQIAEQRVKSQEEELLENRERLSVAGKLNALITTGTAISSTMQSADLQDRAIDIDGLIARAVTKGKEARELKEEFDKLKIEDPYFDSAIVFLREAIQLVGEAAYYYRSFYNSEDADQEQLRERILRQKAKGARDKFEQAATKLAN